MKILIVDDNKSQATLLGDVMKAEGFEILAVSDGREALDVLRKGPHVDCIISDVMMPHIDGFRLAFKVRSDERFVNIPFVLYTAGDALPDDEQFAESIGVDRYLRKPGSSRAIIGVVHEVLGSHRAESSNGQSNRDKWMMSKYGKLLIDKLDSSQRTFELAVDRASIISKAGPDGIITHVNRNFIEASGYSEDEILGKDHRVISSGFHPPSFWQEMWTTIQSGETWRGQVRNKARNGSIFWTDTFVIPILDNTRTITEYLSIRTDITAAKVHEEELQQSRRLLEKAQSAAHLGYWTFDGNTITCSPETICILGLSDASFDGSVEKMFQFVHPDDRQTLLERRRKMILGEGVFDMDFRVLVNEKIRWAHARAETTQNKDGSPAGAIGVIQDITVRKQTEQSLREFSDRYDLLTRATNDAVWDLDLRNGTIVWNHAIKEVFGYGPDLPVSSEWWLARVHPEDLPILLSHVDGIKQNRESNWSLHYRYPCADGSYKSVFNRSYILYDDEGNAVRMIGSLQDVTEKKRAAEELEKLSLVASKTNNSVLILDRELKIDWVNEGFQNLTGYKEEQVRGRGVDMLYGEETDRNIMRRITRSFANQVFSSEELINYGQEGRKYWVRSDTTPVFAADGSLRYFICIQTDISELKDVETSIVTIAQELSNLIENANVPIIGIDTDGRINEWNKTAASILEYQKSEIHGQLAAGLFDSGSAMHFNYIVENVFREVATQTVELKVVTKTNKRLTLLISVSARHNSAQEVIGAIIVAQNISELTGYRHLLEEKVHERTRELNEALAKEKELVEMKSRFVSIVSHEFRTPLSTISVTTGMVKKHHQKLGPEELVRRLDNIEKQVAHMTYLLDDVLLVERANAGKLKVQRKELNLHDFLSALCEEVQASRGHSHKIQLAGDVLIPTIFTDEKLLRSVLVNLLTNAIKFSPNCDRVEVTVTNDLEKTTLAVRDFGIGVPKAEVQNLFQPFFRGTNAGNIQGTGLGLSIIRKSVDLLKGSVSMESEEGKGTQFTITLPTSNA